MDFGLVNSTVVTKQPNIANSATQKGSRGNSTTTKNTEAQSESFSTLGIGELLTVCSFLGLKDRLNIKTLNKEFSLHTKNLLSFSTTALQKLAEVEATTWINNQLQLVDQDPIKLIQKIETIPDDLYKPITRNILINKAIEVANTIPDDIKKIAALQNIIRPLLASGNIERAIELANTIPDYNYKSLTLGHIRQYEQSNQQFNEQRNQFSCTVS
tara:strand:+ start:61 stop:702 length:642 start_codon:yes stop_codon:yes gene_type:complete